MAIIKEFGEFPDNVRQEYARKANWKVDGQNGDWSRLVDPNYSLSIKHIAVCDQDGNIK